MTIEEMGPAALIAVLISILVEWLPGLAAWWEGLSASRKRHVMAFLVLLASLASLGINCGVRGNCPADVWGTVWELVLTFLVAAAANQAWHSLMKRG